jgi:Uma2 family endonuclease
MASSTKYSADSGNHSERLMTLDEYEYANPFPGGRTELVAGRLLVRDSPKQRHGQVVVRVLAALIRYLDRHFATEAEAGLLLSNDVGILLRLEPPTVRAPDIGYYVATRAPADTGRYAAVLPDVVVEVRSPTDRSGYLHEKIGAWKDAGCGEIWVLDPTKRTFSVHSAADIRVLGEGERYDGGRLFSCLDLHITPLFA